MKIKIKKLKGGFAKGEFILGYVNMQIHEACFVNEYVHVNMA